MRAVVAITAVAVAAAAASGAVNKAGDADVRPQLSEAEILAIFAPYEVRLPAQENTEPLQPRSGAAMLLAKTGGRDGAPVSAPPADARPAVVEDELSEEERKAAEKFAQQAMSEKIDAGELRKELVEDEKEAAEYQSKHFIATDTKHAEVVREDNIDLTRLRMGKTVHLPKGEIVVTQVQEVVVEVPQEASEHDHIVNVLEEHAEAQDVKERNAASRATACVLISVVAAWVLF